jgi:hypothetical protein
MGDDRVFLATVATTLMARRSERGLGDGETTWAAARRP